MKTLDGGIMRALILGMLRTEADKPVPVTSASGIAPGSTLGPDGQVVYRVIEPIPGAEVEIGPVVSRPPTSRRPAR